MMGGASAYPSYGGYFSLFSLFVWQFDDVGGCCGLFAFGEGYGIRQAFDQVVGKLAHRIILSRAASWFSTGGPAVECKVSA